MWGLARVVVERWLKEESRLTPNFKGSHNRADKIAKSKEIYDNLWLMKQAESVVLRFGLAEFLFSCQEQFSADYTWWDQHQMRVCVMYVQF